MVAVALMACYCCICYINEIELYKYVIRDGPRVLIDPWGVYHFTAGQDLLVKKPTSIMHKILYAKLF